MGPAKGLPVGSYKSLDWRSVQLFSSSLGLAMNGHLEHSHANGQQGTRTEHTEAQLDAYQEELTRQAVLDEVKVHSPA